MLSNRGKFGACTRVGLIFLRRDSHSPDLLRYCTIFAPNRVQRLLCERGREKQRDLCEQAPSHCVSLWPLLITRLGLTCPNDVLFHVPPGGKAGSQIGLSDHRFCTAFPDVPGRTRATGSGTLAQSSCRSVPEAAGGGRAFLSPFVPIEAAKVSRRAWQATCGPPSNAKDVSRVSSRGRCSMTNAPSLQPAIIPSLSLVKHTVQMTGRCCTLSINSPVPASHRLSVDAEPS